MAITHTRRRMDRGGFASNVNDRNRLTIPLWLCEVE